MQQREIIVPVGGNSYLSLRPLIIKIGSIIWKRNLAHHYNFSINFTARCKKKRVIKHKHMITNKVGEITKKYSSLPIETHPFGKVRYLLIVSSIPLISGYNFLVLFITQQQTKFPFPLVYIGH